MEEELGIARDLLDKTNQPYSYLIKAVEEKDIEIVRLK